MYYGWIEYLFSLTSQPVIAKEKYTEGTKEIHFAYEFG